MLNLSWYFVCRCAQNRSPHINFLAVRLHVQSCVSVKTFRSKCRLSEEKQISSFIKVVLAICSCMLVNSKRTFPIEIQMNSFGTWNVLHLSTIFRANVCRSKQFFLTFFSWFFDKKVFRCVLSFYLLQGESMNIWRLYNCRRGWRMHFKWISMSFFCRRISQCLWSNDVHHCVENTVIIVHFEWSWRKF